MPEFVIDPINSTQREFIYAPERFSCWDGGVWTGKTAGIVLRAHMLSTLFPGNRGVFLRFTEEDLMNTVKATFKKMIPSYFYDTKRGGKDTQNYTQYINGSEILWMHLRDISIKKLMSLEIGWFAISQAEECEASAYEMLESRMRHIPKGWPKGKHFPQYGMVECNPNAKDWIYYKFHPDQCTDRDNYRYFFTSTEDNGDLMKEQNKAYYASLKAKPESWKRRYFYGSREISEGSWHKEFETRTHCYFPPKASRLPDYNPGKVLAVDFDPFKERKIRSIYAFFDYGLSAETACEWMAIDSEGFRWFFAEWYGIKTTIEENVAQLKVIESKFAGPVSARYADPTIFYMTRRDQMAAQMSGNKSVADEYASYGFQMQEADHSQAMGFENAEELIHIRPELVNPVTHKLGSPKVFFSMKCRNLVAQISQQKKALKRNPLSGETEWSSERDPNVPDHAYDCFVYSANMKQIYIPYDGPLPSRMKRYMPLESIRSHEKKGYM